MIPGCRKEEGGREVGGICVCGIRRDSLTTTLKVVTTWTNMEAKLVYVFFTPLHPPPITLNSATLLSPQRLARQFSSAWVGEVTRRVRDTIR